MEYNHKFSKSAPVLVAPKKKKRRRRLTNLFVRRKKGSRSEIRAQESRDKDTFLPPPPVLYLTIYNLSRAENLLYNKNRGFLPEEVRWEIIRKARPEWIAEDTIWAIGTDGSEYVCSCDLIGQNPVFHLLKSFMRRETLTKHICTIYKTYYFEDLLQALFLSPQKETPEDKWFLVQDPETGKVLEVL